MNKVPRTPSATGADPFNNRQPFEALTNSELELLHFGSVFHDLGLTAKYRSQDHRFEIDSANAAREFLRANGIDEASVGVVWDAIALHTTPEIPWHKRPEIALVTGGVEADVLGDGLGEIPAGDRDAVLAAYPLGG